MKTGRNAAAAVLGLIAAFQATAGTAAQKLDFQAPTLDDPAYLIKARFEVKGKLFRLLNVDLPRGSPYQDVLILKDGKPADTSKNLEPGTYEAALRYAWRSSAAYSAFLHFIEDEREGPKVAEMKGTAPAAGGIPAEVREGFSDVQVVSEEAGIARKGEVVYLTLTAPKKDLEGVELAVFDGANRLPHQIVEAKESVPPASQAATHPPTLTAKIAIEVDVAPRERKLLRVFKASSGPRPDVSDAFRLSGEGLGKTVRGPSFALELHPQSGQILTVEDFAARVKLFNKAGVIHWNPDVFIPGIAWDHSFDWNPPPAFEEKNGPVLYLNSRSGPMPRVKDVFLEVKYTLEGKARHFLAETRMRVDRDLGVVALRNDEMVLFKDLFDTLVYRDKGGRVIRKPLREIPGSPYGLAHIAPPDLGWVGLLNLKAGFGFFSLRLESSTSNLSLGGGLPRKAGTYFYAPSDGDYVYWVRPWLYTWGEFATSQRLTALPAGSVFYEKNAYLVSRWTEGTAEDLDRLLERLKNPLRVF
jgi:hypothetical protein